MTYNFVYSFRHLTYLTKLHRFAMLCCIKKAAILSCCFFRGRIFLLFDSQFVGSTFPRATQTIKNREIKSFERLPFVYSDDFGVFVYRYNYCFARCIFNLKPAYFTLWTEFFSGFTHRRQLLQFLRLYCCCR